MPRPSSPELLGAPEEETWKEEVVVAIYHMAAECSKMTKLGTRQAVSIY